MAAKHNGMFPLCRTQLTNWRMGTELALRIAATIDVELPLEGR